MSSAEAAELLGGSLCQIVLEFVKTEVAAQASRPRFLSKQALAVYLGVPPRTIKTWREHGLPGRKVGREVMYDLAEVERWIDGEGR